MALEMKFGGDRKQLITLSVLGVVLLVVLYMNYFSGPDDSPRATPRPASNPPRPALAKGPTAAESRKKMQLDRRAQEFRPRVGPARPEDRLDPMKVDPSLRVELLARLEKITVRGGSRSLFDFSNEPSPTTESAVAKIIPAPKKSIAAPKPFIGPLNEPPPAPKPVVQKPQAPPIPLRFYGYASAPRGASKRGFFLDGEEIVVAAEGELIKQRYKVIRIGLANVTMEDTQYQQQQTLPIVPDNSGGA